MWTTDAYERHSLDHDFLNLFARGMVKYFQRSYAIPVYPASVTSHAIGGNPCGIVRILHCHYGSELHGEDWEIMGRIGREFASGFYPDGYQDGSVSWHANEPSEWHLTGYRLL